MCVLKPLEQGGKVQAGGGGWNGGGGFCPLSVLPSPEEKKRPPDFLAALPDFNVNIQAPPPSPEPPGYLGKEPVDTADHPPAPPQPLWSEGPRDRLQTAGAGHWPRPILGNNLTSPM